MSLTSRQRTARDHARKALSVKFSVEESQRLVAVASVSGRSPEAIVKTWVGEKLEVFDRGRAAAAASPAANAIDEIGEISRLLASLNARMERLEHSSYSTADRSSTARRRGAGKRRSSGVGSGKRESRTGSVSLHDEIVDVLRTSTGPMSASDIADAIRQRARYRVPRSEKPVSGAMISSRVSNPYYRDLFRRVNRKIALAE